MSKFGKMKTIIAGGLLSALMASSALAEDITLKIAGVSPVNHFGTAIIENMGKEIEAANVGLKVRFFPGAQLGTGEELTEDVIRGNVDIAHAFVYAHADPRLEIMNLPYVIRSFDEMRSLYSDPKSVLNQVIDETLDDLGLVHLSLIGEGLQGVCGNLKSLNQLRQP